MRNWRNFPHRAELRSFRVHKISTLVIVCISKVDGDQHIMNITNFTDAGKATTSCT
jgi:hypothetical protein